MDHEVKNGLFIVLCLVCLQGANADTRSGSTSGAASTKSPNRTMSLGEISTVLYATYQSCGGDKADAQQIVNRYEQAERSAISYPADLHGLIADHQINASALSMMGAASDAALSRCVSEKLATVDIDSIMARSTVSQDKGRPDLRPIRYVAPVYPARMLSRNFDGWVDVEFSISTSGHPTGIIVIESSHQAFERSAVRAVTKWLYEVQQDADGRPVEVKHATRVEFFLE